MSKPQIIPFDRNAPLVPWEDFPEIEITSGTRKQNGLMLFEDKARGLSAGIWEQGANESRWMDYPVNEFMTVLEGEVVIVEEDRSVSITAGEFHHSQGPALPLDSSRTGEEVLRDLRGCLGAGEQGAASHHQDRPCGQARTLDTACGRHASVARARAACA